MTRSRLDQELVKRSLMSSRSGARAAIRDGLVRVDGVQAGKPAARVATDSVIEVDPRASRFVGRGSRKLDAALEHFEISIAGRRAVDVGSSTGGFTDVLLDAGAVGVVAVDVGHDQLHPRLLADERVEACEGINIRYVDAPELGAPFDVITVDLSFISLGLVADVLARLGGDDSDWVVLVKPQFEVDRGDLGKGGVVRSEMIRDAALERVVGYFASAGLVTVGAIPSPIKGGSGNSEALLWLRRGGMAISAANVFKVAPDA